MSRHGSPAAGSCWVVTRFFLVATELFSLCFSGATRALKELRQCFVFYRDNVAIEVPLSRPRWPRQEVRVATGACEGWRARQCSVVLCRD